MANTVTLTTKVILGKNIKMDRDYKNVLNYTESDMINLLESNSHLVAEISNASFVNPTGTILVPFTYDQCLKSNYMAFQNPNFSNKWFFCFIDKIIFHSKKCQEIQYTVDSWTTWWDKWSVKPCFVVREHVNDDTIGLHTVDEGLDVGEVICTSSTSAITWTNGYFYVVIATTHDPRGNGTDFSGCTIYNKNIFGTLLFLVKIDYTSSANLQNSMNTLSHFLSKTNTQKSGDVSCIHDMFIIPPDFIPQGSIQEVDFDDYKLWILSQSYTADRIDFKIPIEHSTPTGYYSPINNKCYCYPYNYLYLTNNSGSDNIYKYEDFYFTVTESGIEKLVFSIFASIGIGYSAKIVPNGYKNVGLNTSEEISLGKFPVCGWSSDSYTNWLTQNGINEGLGILKSTLKVLSPNVTQISPTSTGQNPTISGSYNFGSSLNVANDLLSTIGRFETAKLLPNIAQGNNNGNVNFSLNDLNFDFRKMRCKDEFMKQVDSYFSMFGYKINEIKVPNLTGRTNFNYIQISEADDIGYGTVPSVDMDIINKICRRGVTIWHNHSNLGDYSVTNTIVT